MNNEHAGSECSEGCAGFKPLPGNSWSNYGICKKPGSPNRGFPVQRGRSCHCYFPPATVPAKSSLARDEPDATNEAR